MLRSFKVSSSVQECVFYRPELTEKWGPHKIVIRFWKISFSQTVDEKNGVIRLVAYSQSYVHQKKYQKWLILYTFCWIQQISPSLGKIFKCISDFIWPFQKMLWIMYYGLATISKISTSKYTGILVFLCSLRNFSVIYPQYPWSS